MFLKHISFLAAVTFPLLLNGQFKSTVIQRNGNGNELFISINPLVPGRVLAATNSGFYISERDTGRTWSNKGDWCSKRSYHNNPLSYWNNLDACCSQITGGDTSVMGVDYNNSAQVTQSDCYLHVINPDTRIFRLRIYPEAESWNQHEVWTQVPKHKSHGPTDSSVIMYSFKNQRGLAWQEPKRISVTAGDCSNGDSTLMGAACCTGPNGEVYAAWAGPQGLVFRNISGDMFPEKIVSTIKNGWRYTIGKNAVSNGLPTLACDLSKGEHRGRIYTCWSDEKHGVHNKNVFLSYSDDQGETWTEPIVVTYRPNHKEQFMPYMTVDAATGYIYILYYDQQNFADGDATDLYLARSKNGGLKFEYYRVNDRPIYPEPATHFGNSMALSAVNGIIRPIWAQRDHKNVRVVYTALMDEQALDNYEKNEVPNLEIQRTFSWAKDIKIDFTIKKNTQFTAVITKPLEAGFEKTVIRNKKIKKGKNHLIIDTESLGLPKGNYTLTLYHDHKNEFVWIIDE